MVCISNISNLNIPFGQYRSCLNNINVCMNSVPNTRSQSTTKTAILQWLYKVAGEDWVNRHFNKDSCCVYEILTVFLLNCKNPFKLFKLIPGNWIENIQMQTFLDLIEADDMNAWNNGNSFRGFRFLALFGDKIPDYTLRSKFGGNYKYAINFINMLSSA